MVTKKTRAKPVTRDKTWSLPSGIQLHAVPIGRPGSLDENIWSLEVCIQNPLEKYSFIQSEEELDCLVKLLLEKYEHFDSLLHILQS